MKAPAIDLHDDALAWPDEIPSPALHGALRGGAREACSVEPAMCLSSTALRRGAPRRRVHRVRRGSIGRYSSWISAWSSARSSARFDAPSPARSRSTRLGLATGSPWSSTMSSSASARGRCTTMPLMPSADRGAITCGRPGGFVMAPMSPGRPVTQSRPRPGGEQRGAVPTAQEPRPVSDGVDAVQDRDEPAHPDSPVDLIVAETEAPQLSAADDTALSLRERDQRSLHPFWAGLTVHITVYPAQNRDSPPGARNYAGCSP
jgi:hypothetical protein